MTGLQLSFYLVPWLYSKFTGYFGFNINLCECCVIYDVEEDDWSAGAYCLYDGDTILLTPIIFFPLSKFEELVGEGIRIPELAGLYC
jgi:hypothetical protein